jgi:uncharacterized membrane protein
MLNKFLSIVLLLAIISAIGASIYFGAAPKAGETFTEFYLLGENSTFANYPEQLAIGEAGKVIVGIINHENKQTSYLIKLLIAGQESNETGPILLVDGEKWEGEMSFIPKVPGDSQKVEFLLFKGEDMVTPSNSLHLWVNVKDKVK